MKAIVFDGVKNVLATDVAEPQLIQDTDVIVKVLLAALCGSDVHIYTGKDDLPDIGTIMGHEFVGIVTATGNAVAKLQVGDRVVSPFTTCCGQCFFCSVQLPARCEKGQLFGWARNNIGLQGAQAQFVRVPLADSTLVKVDALTPPDAPKLANEQAVLLGDIIPTALFAADNGGVAAETGRDFVAVFGCGPVGLMAVCAALHRGAKTVLAIDKVPERLQIAASFGAQPLQLGESADECIQEIRRRTDGRGVDVALEMVGAPSALRLAFDACRPGGTLSSIGVYGDQENFPFQPVDMYNKNLTFRSGRCPARRYMERDAVQVVQQFAVTKIVSHVVGLDESAEMYAQFCARTGGCMKVLFDPWKEPLAGVTMLHEVLMQ